MNGQPSNANDAASVVDDYSIDPRVRVGHVHLKVADIERSLAFYCGVLGFGVNISLGEEAVFLAAGGYHHHLALNTWESRGGAAPLWARRAYTMSPFSIRRDLRWRLRCAACEPQG